jgi:hypothetical protein
MTIVPSIAERFSCENNLLQGIRLCNN